MSLPPGFIDELRDRLSIAQVVGRKVMWDNRKSNPGKGDMWAPCPFHQEKSASFHVDDRKGYYYCFGCHAKGDAISFVRETENVSFVEAVEILAREAGMPIPERDPQAQARADKRTQLTDVMDLAVQFYRMQLRTGAAADARAYLTKRGLSDAAQDRWSIGFAPNGWQSLRDALAAKGVSDDLLIGAGLVKPSDQGKKPYDAFRNRIMFPIRDVRGRAIAFGGRAMDPADSAKYLNSPETALFDKGRSLFNHGPAREASGKGKPLIVAEGYMDVIALVEAGFPATVAPLGTAVTPDQLALMWRMADEPIIALDGDSAGIKAAMRVMDLALPLLEAGKSLRFAVLPTGLDPDDLIRAQGAAAMQAVIDAALPMVQLLWRRETEGRVFDSPERKAALDKALRDATAQIKESSLRGHYETALKDLKWQAFGFRKTPGPRRAPQARWSRQPLQPWHRDVAPSSGSVASLLATGSDNSAEQDHLREAVILATVLVTPAILPGFDAELERMECADPGHRALRDAILRHAASADLKGAVSADLGVSALEKVFAQRHVAISPAVRRAGDADVARMCLAEELAKLSARRSHAREVEDAIEDMQGLADEGVTWRISQATFALNRSALGDTVDRAEYDIAPNGARIRRDEKVALDDLLGQINFAKGAERPKS